MYAVTFYRKRQLRMRLLLVSIINSGVFNRLNINTLGRNSGTSDILMNLIDEVNQIWNMVISICLGKV